MPQYYKHIDSFVDEHAFLSNFYFIKVTLDGMLFSSVEHAYQAAKTEDLALRAQFQEPITSAAAKSRGRALKKRSDWNSISVPLMTMLNRQKYKDPELRSLLLQTGEAILTEGNWWGDTFWGVSKGVGENHLGIILMQIRDDIRKGKDKEWVFEYR